MLIRRTESQSISYPVVRDKTLLHIAFPSSDATKTHSFRCPSYGDSPVYEKLVLKVALAVSYKCWGLQTLEWFLLAFFLRESSGAGRPFQGR